MKLIEHHVEDSLETNADRLLQKLKVLINNTEYGYWLKQPNYSLDFWD